MAAGGQVSTESREAMGKLCVLYWYPLYAFVRRRGHDPDEAQDLTQGFFARLIEKQDIQAVGPERGKFRSYLLGALKHFLANEWDRAHAKKRGGDRAIVSIDIEDAEGRYRLEPVDGLTPEKLFERQWAVTLLERAMARLQGESADGDKKAVFERLRVFLGGATPGQPYGQAAADLSMTEAAVKMAVRRLRRRYRKLLRAEIAQTVASPAEIDGEIRDLFDALGD